MPKKNNSSSKFDRNREFAVILERVESKVNTLAEGQANQTKEIKLIAESQASQAKEIKLISESQASLIKKTNSLQEGQIEIKKKLDMTYETVGHHEIELNWIKTDIRFIKIDITDIKTLITSHDNRIVRLESSAK